jgi:hypothetical protein
MQFGQLRINSQKAVQNSESENSEIGDPEIKSTMRLAKDGIKALFFKGNKLFSIKTKK